MRGCTGSYAREKDFLFIQGLGRHMEGGKLGLQATSIVKFNIIKTFLMNFGPKPSFDQHMCELEIPSA